MYTITARYCLAGNLMTAQLTKQFDGTVYQFNNQTDIVEPERFTDKKKIWKLSKAIAETK